MATSTEDITNLTLEDIEAASILVQLSKDQYQKQSPKEETIGDEVASTPLLQVSQTHQKPSTKRKKVKNQNQKESTKKKRVTKNQDENNKCEKEDDSEQTLRYMLNYKEKTPENPPVKIFIHDPDAVGDCSKPTRKQLTKSDVEINLCRLMLGEEQVKKMMLDVLGKTLKLDTKGFNASVYGPDGEIHDLKFKKWKLNSVLASPVWMEFVRKYNLNKYCKFLTIWMLTHKKTHQICFAIDSTWFPVYKKLNNRIMKAAAFKNPN